jgi:signal transduction histidine kinase
VATDHEKAAPERRDTDESLRTERQKADRALAAVKVADDTADAVVLRARESADNVLSDARARADQQVARSARHDAPRVVLAAEERRLEDEAVVDERASADERLRKERDEAARALSKLLPLERERTDRHLLTERARSDDAIANRDDFLGIVSHDLRNLLAGIVSSAALLEAQAPAGDEGAATLRGTERIERYAARMSRLIGDLVDIASIDAGKLAMIPVRDDATALIAEAVDTFHATAAARGITVEATPREQPLVAEFDHARMMQVFANLIANAIKFTPRDGKISIHGERVDGELHFCVSDTGAGIPGHMLGSIFERFWQVGENDRRGLGLGLYISRCIVEAHGGRIWAESTLGEGSKVCFTLPCSGP